jgi:hypothetical protein
MRDDRMTSFPEWLGQVGLAHCRQVLEAIDFAAAKRLTLGDLRRLGLGLADSEKLSAGYCLAGSACWCAALRYRARSGRRIATNCRDPRRATPDHRDVL